MKPLDNSRSVGVVGAGTMGAGIAQVAAHGGHRVLLCDAKEGAAAKARQRIGEGLKKLVARAKLSRDDADATVSRIHIVNGVAEMSEVGLVVEAILEDLRVKQQLFAQFEESLLHDAIFATNTSSISVTSIARDLKHPERVVGMHFFNPATLMKLVEVVSGVATSQHVADTVFATAQAWGKKPVHAKSTPGFIVNRVARSYYGEALRLFEEQVADPVTIDALMKAGAGFRMGPFELMDLIGHDVNYAVSASVFDAYYNEPRFRPSIAQLELVNAGRLGRKTGRGFFDYSEGATKPPPKTELARTEDAISDFVLGVTTAIEGTHLQVTNGRSAREVATKLGRPAIVYDLTAEKGCSRLGFAASSDVSAVHVQRFVSTLARQGIAATRLPDWPGLVVMRTVAMLANEAFEAVLQGVASEADIDLAMCHGVNYPKGPMAWARAIGLQHVVAVLDALREVTGDPRYRASFGLRMAATG
jgi:3-hydroxybutyryl-CoA dehydrogenase